MEQLCRLDNICFSISGNRIKEKLGSQNNPVPESLSACVGSWEGIPIFFSFFAAVHLLFPPLKLFTVPIIALDLSFLYIYIFALLLFYFVTLF